MSIDTTNNSGVNNSIVPYTGKENYIFISYSHKDSDNVLPIIRRLVDNGYRVWFDRGIRAGREWDAEIANRVLKCTYFIAAISKNYLESSNCKDELNYARDKEKKRFLVYLEPVDLPPEMEMRLTRVQNIHKYSCEGDADFYSRLFNAEDIELCRNKEEKSPETDRKTETDDSWECYSKGYAYELGKGVKQDYAEAVKWYRLSAARGNAWAQNRLGDCYYNGKGVKLDYKEAFKWYSLAAEQDDITARCNMGRCYFHGHGVEQSYPRAAAIFTYSADMGNAYGIAWLGFCLFNGYGVDKDIVLAKEQYKRAAELGNKWAEDELKKIDFVATSKKSDEKVLTYSERKDLEHKVGNSSESFMVPREYTRISEGAFGDICTKNIYIPSTIETIDRNCFINMSASVRNIYISTNNPYFYVNKFTLIEKSTGTEIPIGSTDRKLSLYHEH